MKKVITIALALLFVISAVSSMAIVVGGDLDGKKVWFDSISISTDKAMADYAVTGVSALADPAGTYVGDQMIFGYLKFGFDDARPEQNTDNINVHIMSDYATFPMWLNQGYATTAGASTQTVVGPARVHLVDKNGILNTFPIYLGNANYTVSPFTIEALYDDEEFLVTFNVMTIVNRVVGYNDPGYPLGGYGFLTNFNAPAQPTLVSKVNGKYATSMYVGFNGIVKDSASTQGVIKAYITSGGSDKFKVVQRAIDAGTFGSNMSDSAGKYTNVPFAAPATNAAMYIDKYKDGKPIYRVYKLFENSAGTMMVDTASNPAAPTINEEYQAYEYLVQPFEDEDTLKDWAVGFQNASFQTTANTVAKYFGKFTYREGLATNPKASPIVIFATASVPTDKLTANAYDNAVVTHTANGVYSPLAPAKLAVNQLYGSGAMKARASDTGKYYKFFKVVEGGQDLDKQFVDKNELDSKVDPIMEYFGFSYNYLNATNDSHYTSGGWKDYKEATFNYFGASIPTDDDDVVPAETGDASTTIVIVLAASALLAAAALFFVMKKARD